MLNPYEEELLRRRQQQEMNQPQFQQPAPMANLPLYSGPVGIRAEEVAGDRPPGGKGAQRVQAGVE